MAEIRQRELAVLPERGRVPPVAPACKQQSRIADGADTRKQPGPVWYENRPE